MTTFSDAPKLTKGRLDIIDPGSTRVAASITFQYNPGTLTRKLNPRWMSEESRRRRNRNDALRMRGAPEETIELDVEVDAADHPEDPQEEGIYPQLAALENLVYPASDQVSQNSRRLRRGAIEVSPTEASRTLLVWGKNRVLPVQLTDFTITEEAHDPNLNPIRAKVSLSLRVLSYNDLPLDHPVCSDFRTYHQKIEEMAAKGRNL